MSPSSTSRRRLLARLLFGGAAILLLGALWIIGDTLFRTLRDRRAQASAVNQPLARASQDCRSCHEDVYREWSDSHHAKAHRVVERRADRDAFQTPQSFTLHGVSYNIAWENDRPKFVEQRAGQPDYAYTADFVLGHTPLWQYVVPTVNGRFQLSELAFDPAKREWFNVFGDEGRQPGEWGHWTGRGMNWNSMCAHCHLTDFSKNYDAKTDTYASTWTEHGVGCVQCHGDLAPDHARPGYKTLPVLRAQLADRGFQQQTCAPCHARNELLTGAPRPGQLYHDHYRITLPTDPRVFYPDGQVRDEDFNWTSLITSRMGGKAGVTCLDCHEPHTGKTRLPAANNALCLSCHGGVNRLSAPIIDPTAHSRHKGDSTGNRCIECHMPTTTYMQRDPRHDHGFLSPDPLLTKELGIPNACNRCHTDKTTEWAIEATDQWYGEKMNGRQRQRTRVVAAAQRGEPSAATQLLDLIRQEDVPAWKATLLQLSARYAQTEPKVLDTARMHLADADPLVRSAAAQALSGDPESAALLRPLLKDPARLVRLDAAWALSPELAADSTERKELDAYLSLALDQPAGQLRFGQDLANRGRLADAEPYLRRAIEWDPYSPPFYSTLGSVLDALNRPAEAAQTLTAGAQANPREPSLPFEAGLAFAAAGRMPEAEKSLREALRREPRFDRAWYNLGLLLSQQRRRPEAIDALKKAVTLAPGVADYPYALATLLLQTGDRDGAVDALQRTLRADPAHPNARALFERLK